MGALGPGTREDKYWTLAVLTWEDLQRILRDKTMEELARKEEMQQRYSVFKRQLKEEWVSTEDYLLARYFNFPMSLCSERQKLVSTPPAGGVPNLLVWAANDFPYSLEPGIEHHCVWAPSHEAAAPAALDAFVEAHRPSSDWETLRFVNPAHLRSVRNVWHAHVMSRRRTPQP